MWFMAHAMWFTAHTMWLTAHAMWFTAHTMWLTAHAMWFMAHTMWLSWIEQRFPKPEVGSSILPGAITSRESLEFGNDSKFLPAANAVHKKIAVYCKHKVGVQFFGKHDDCRIREVHWQVRILIQQ